MGMDIVDLVARIQSRKALIGVIGMGYVGLPLMLAATSQQFRVLGFDTDSKRILALNGGISPLRHVPSELIGAARGSDLFEATGEFSRLVETDCILICVPTPLTAHREPDLSFIEGTARVISRALRSGQLVVLESTSFPGTTIEIVKPILESTGLRSQTDFLLAYSPEREDPGNVTFSTSTIPKVVAGDGPDALAAATALYSAFIAEIVQVSSTDTAEAVKILENTFRAVNVALVNELKMIFEKLGIDIFEVIDAAKTKPFGFMPFYPGPGLGGHCIPIDPFYLSWKARGHGINARFIELAGEINSDMPHYIVEHVARAIDRRFGLGLSRSRILVVGVAYKKNVDDMRESPSLKLIELLEARGALTEYHDPFVAELPLTRMHRNLAHRRSIDLRPEIVAGFDAALIATDHDIIDYACLFENAKLIIDTRNVCARHGFVGSNIVKA